MSAARIRAAALQIGRVFGVGGATWTRTRTTAHTPAADGTATEATVTLRVVPNGRPTTGATLPGLPVFQADYVAIAPDTDVLQAGDTLTNDTLTFAVTGAPFTDMGFTLAPLEKQP